MDHYLLPYGGELAYYFSKLSNAPWLARVGGWAQLELTDTSVRILGILFIKIGLTLKDS